MTRLSNLRSWMVAARIHRGTLAPLRRHRERHRGVLGPLLAVLVVFIGVRGAAAAGLNWEISRFDTEITVHEDGSFDVEERIVADFSRDPHHGILREIPYSYRRNGTSFRLRMGVESITDEQGNAWWHEASREKGRLKLKIGDPIRTFGRNTTYVIRYHVQRGLLRFEGSSESEGHDELYWNATGNEWPIPIARAACTVRMPDTVPLDTVRATSYAGAYGSRAEGPAPEFLPEEHAVRFTLDRRLPPQSGLTVVVGWELGHVATPTASTRAGWFIRDNIVILTPVVVLVGLLGLWWFFGRDQGSPGSVVVQYEAPHGLTPVEIGTLIDERVDMRDVTATIIDLATRGFLRIEVRTKSSRQKPRPEKVWLIRQVRDESKLKPFEKTLLSKLFESKDEVKLSDLQYKFRTTLGEVRGEVYRSLRDEGYVDGHLGIRRGAWMAIGILAACGTVVLGVILARLDVFAPLTTIIAIVLTAPQFPVFAYFMPRKTAAGRRALEEIKGLEEYIRRAEKEDLESNAATARFEGLLGCAMALGLAEEWARRFKGIYDTPPDWYRCPTPQTWSTVWLVHHLARSETSMNTALAAAPRSSGGGGWSSGGFGGGSSGFSGGGFSGGGGGGGGGGGW